MSSFLTIKPDELFTLGVMSQRSSEDVVFISSTDGRLIDNIKYLYFYCVSHPCPFKPYLYTSNRDVFLELSGLNLPVVHPNYNALEVLKRAGAVVYDTLPTDFPEPYLLGIGALQMQLWHGVGFKKTGLGEINSPPDMYPGRQEFIRVAYPPYDVVLSISPWCTENLFSKVFKADTFLEIGYPRNDIFFRSLTKYDLYNVDTGILHTLKRHKSKGGKIVFYVPTFRSKGYDFINDEGQLALDIKGLMALSKKHNILYVFKLHRYSRKDLFSSNYEQILCYDSTKDLYPVMGMADVLITDYSSIYSDFLIQDKPIFFYPYDFERYIRREREMIISYDDTIPGSKSLTFDELAERIDEFFTNSIDEYKQKRTLLRSKINPQTEASASRDIVAYLGERLNNADYSINKRDRLDYFYDRYRSFFNK